jgi:hypothetical protein
MLKMGTEGLPYITPRKKVTPKSLSCCGSTELRIKPEKSRKVAIKTTAKRSYERVT